MKKLLSVFLCFIMLISFSTTSFAMNNNEVLSYDENLKITLVEQSDGYEKVEMMNKTNGEIEYLESILEDDGSYTYKATTNDKTYEIKNINGKITIIDNNGEVSIIDSGIIDDLSNNVSNDNDVSDNNDISKGSACIPNSNWSTFLTGSSSVALNVTDSSLIAGIIVSIVGGPVSGVITTIAAWYASRFIKNAYYTYKQETRMHDGWVEERTYYTWYEDEKHTKKIKDVYSPISKVHLVGTPCK